MKSTGHHGEKARYRIVLLVAVGLTAFSSAMKELNQVQQLGLDASRLVAQWTAKAMPEPVPAEAPQMVVRVESCESKQSAPSVELPWLDDVAEAETVEVDKVQPPVIVKRIRNSKTEVAKLKREFRFDFDPKQFEVRISTDHNAEADEPVISGLPVISDFPAIQFKTKTRKHGAVRINPRDREILLKTLNRSINLRSAS